MELNQFMPLRELFARVRTREDREADYSVYWKDGTDDPLLDDAVLVAAPVTVENDTDVFPAVVTANAYWLLCSDELLQDVVDVALGQNPEVNDETLRAALLHYIKRDNFLDITHGS